MSDASDPYGGTTPVPRRADGTVTLVEGQTFCLSGRAGDVDADLAQGLFMFDTRVLSAWSLRVDGHLLEPLAVEFADPFAATFVTHSVPPRGRADSELVVFRHRHVGWGMRERVTIMNYGTDPVTIAVELRCDVDFADLFEVKEGHVRTTGHQRRGLSADQLEFATTRGAPARTVTIALSGDPATRPGAARWDARIEPRQTWEVCIEVRVTVGVHDVSPRFRCGGEDAAAVPKRQLDDWRATFPVIETDDTELSRTLERSELDLGTLRIFDPEHPELPVLAAGAPWFMTVFGRDSLLTAWMTLLADSSLAHGVLETLARFQGSDVDPSTEEEPGRILHEIRFAGADGLSFGGGDVYYGSIDATPLFVMLLGELHRWDPSDEIVDRLLPNADRAMAWIERFGDRDGDGYVEYARSSEQGLVNQGWKDSWDAIRSADGDLATPPIALAEVQGYVYAAYLARAHLARSTGDDEGVDRWIEKAEGLRRRFNDDFWLDDLGTYALGLDGDKRPIDAVASNVGHCLWTGIVDPDRAGSVADHLLSDELFSGFGVRTLSRSMAAYNPVSYHNGSVWPHDNALCAAGLARYGFTDHAHRVLAAQLDVAGAHDGALPELFAGFGRDEVSTPAPYPSSCSPQAWAAAAPLLWLRTILRLDPAAEHGELWIAPALPPRIRRLRVEGIRIADRSLSVAVDEYGVEVSGAGPLRVLSEPRPPLSTTLVSRRATAPTSRRADADPPDRRTR